MVEDVAAFYDSWAEEYSHSMDAPIPAYHRSAFQALVCQALDKSLGKGLRVLDIGSGDGRDLCFIARNCPNIIEAVGIDVSSKQIQRARQRCGGVSGSIVRFVHGDAISFLANHLLSDSQPFDLIFSNFGVFNFLNKEELQTLLVLAGETLSPDGLLFFSVLNKSSLPEKVYFLITGQWPELNRRERITHSGYKNAIIELRYYSAKELLLIIKSLPSLSDGSRLTPIGRFSTGIVVPPPFARTPSILLSLLIGLDRVLLPLSRFLPVGEFVILALARRVLHGHVKE